MTNIQTSTQKVQIAASKEDTKVAEELGSPVRRAAADMPACDTVRMPP